MNIETAKTKPGLLNLYNSLSNETKQYFSDLPQLINDFTPNIVLSYVFFKLEQGQRMALYCGARKLHKTESTLTWKAIDSQHMTRESYLKYFATIYGFKHDIAASQCIADAEKIRDKVMHGSRVGDKNKLEAISKALQYVEIMNNYISKKKECGFKPFNNNLRGFVGRLSSLDKSTTRWILKGMNFDVD